MAELEVDSTRKRRGAGDNVLGEIDSRAVASTKAHPLDSEDSRREHRKLLAWFYREKEKQAANRLEMATDHDFYDNIQWDPEDAATLRDRGQMSLVYNEVAPMCDWLIGTERRTRVDWKVLPRTEDDVQMAGVKTDVMKYIADVNRVQFLRSRAFADSVKGGVGWMDDGARDDPTQDVLYSKYEDWRNVLWDSDGYELDLSDARYVFRWRWVDEDVAVMMFPDRADRVRRGVENTYNGRGWSSVDDELTIEGTEQAYGASQRSGVLYGHGVVDNIDTQRRKVRLIECQYRKPARVQVVSAGPHRGSVFDPRDLAMVDALQRVGGSIIDKVMMVVHVAVFTEGDMLSMARPVYRHNRYSLTPVWCYRRNRDRLPYGAIRRVRDIQQDLNKRASKALFMLNTNQVIADEDATQDWDAAMDEVQRPDGRIVIKRGARFDIRRDTDAATGQIQMMTLAAQSIQKGAGVSQENMGRQTNAVSGEAIKARQMQGSVVTTEPFDNLRYAVQVQGEKQLSLAEQFYTEEKVIRLTGTRGSLKWVHINRPERQPDGSVRYLDDMTARAADFVVSEQDYAGTLRQVMFDSLSNIAGRVPPEMAMRLLTMAFEFSDLPNKDEIAEQFRKLTGERDPNKEMTPEEEQAAQQQQQLQMEALELQRQQAQATLQEQLAKIRKLNAEADRVEAEAANVGADQVAAAAGVRAEASAEIDRLTQDLVKAQAQASDQVMKIQSGADTALEVARINAQRDIRIAEIRAASDERIDRMHASLERPGGEGGASAPAPAKAPAKPAGSGGSRAAAAVPELNLHVNVTNNVPDQPPPTVKVDVQAPPQAAAPMVHIAPPQVTVNNQVQPAAVTVIDNHPTRAVQTVERDENDEVTRTVTHYERPQGSHVSTTPEGEIP